MAATPRPAATDPPRTPARPALESSGQVAERVRRSAANYDYLHELWGDLLREHRGETVIVYGDRQVMIGRDPLALLGRFDLLPRLDRESAVRQFISPSVNFGYSGTYQPPSLYPN